MHHFQNRFELIRLRIHTSGFATSFISPKQTVLWNAVTRVSDFPIQLKEQSFICIDRGQIDPLKRCTISKNGAQHKQAYPLRQLIATKCTFH